MLVVSQKPALSTNALVFVAFATLLFCAPCRAEQDSHLRIPAELHPPGEYHFEATGDRLNMLIKPLLQRRLEPNELVKVLPRAKEIMHTISSDSVKGILRNPDDRSQNSVIFFMKGWLFSLSIVEGTEIYLLSKEALTL